ncbi:MAG: hypothetical protein HY646_20800, partial [Acidobacteria bacterium]|nr:hypothetical protein [Acidobacteriota bacterium]
MPAFTHDQFVIRRDLRPSVPEALRGCGETGEYVELRYDRSALPNPAGFFGDPIPCDDYAQRAARTALDMQREIVELQKRWQGMG